MVIEDNHLGIRLDSWVLCLVDPPPQVSSNKMVIFDNHLAPTVYTTCVGTYILMWLVRSGHRVSKDSKNRRVMEIDRWD